MLVIRKDLKVGLGIVAAVVGVAVIYGGMSLLTSGSTQDRVTFSPGDSQTSELPSLNLDDAVAGLPPREDPPAGRTSQTPSADIFSESLRSDGSSNTDKWATAWSTGRVTASVRNETSTSNSFAANPDQSIIGTPSVLPTGTDTVIRTVTPTAAPAVSSPPVPTTSGKYTVAPGDTFSSIAAKLYGNRNLYHVIEKANPGVDPRKLKVGQEINVPAPQAVTNIADSVRTTAAQITGTIDTTRQYRVQPGDTLHRISQKLYGKTKYWSAIYDLNKQAIGPDAGKIKIGMVLELPQVPVAD